MHAYILVMCSVAATDIALEGTDMPGPHTVWMLENQNIAVTVTGCSLDGITQGDGWHLLNRTITLNKGIFVRTLIADDDTTSKTPTPHSR